MASSSLGVHPTPRHIVDEFADFVVGEFTSRVRTGNGGTLRVLDLFAGDARLGRAVAARLSRRTRTSLTSVEINAEHAAGGAGSIVADAFKWDSPAAFDLVVANPPYGRVTRRLADDLDLDWGRVRAGAQNLYGLGILKCLDLCRPGGVVGAISPFGWLRGARGAELREVLRSRCEQVTVIGSPDRVRFDGPQQDTGFHMLVARNGGPPGPAPFLFGYEGSAIAPFLSSGGGEVIPSDLRVRVGGLVWNRSRDALGPRRRGTVPVLYGGNIRPGGTIDFDEPRYRARQFIGRSSLPQGLVTEGPYLAIRRTLRGKPGAWAVDIAIGSGPIVAENHVILVESLNGRDLHSLGQTLTRALQSQVVDLGSPSLSVTLVRSALRV